MRCDRQIFTLGANCHLTSSYSSIKTGEMAEDTGPAEFPVRMGAWPQMCRANPFLHSVAGSQMSPEPHCAEGSGWLLGLRNWMDSESSDFIHGVHQSTVSHGAAVLLEVGPNWMRQVLGAA